MNIPVQEYFTRQAALRDIGSQGISKLQQSRVAIVGVGGVGSAIAYYLSRSGVGYLRVIDQDIVLESNLQRLQGLDYRDIYQPKAEAIAQRLSESQLSCKMEPVVETLTRQNSSELLNGVDLVVDGLDNFRGRYLVNEYSVAESVPYLFTSSVGHQIHIALFAPPSTGCLECGMPGVVDRSEESCESIGVAVAATGLTGSLAASVAVRNLLDLSTDVFGNILTLDLVGPDFILSTLNKRESCNICGYSGNYASGDLENVFMLCGQNTANVLPTQSMRFDLSALSRDLPKDVLLRLSDSVIVYKSGPYTVSLFKNGRVIIEGVSNEKDAMKIAEQARQLVPQILTSFP